MTDNCASFEKPFGCSVEATLSVISGRWKPVILFKLLGGAPLRFGELRAQVPGASQRVLTKQLRELEQDGVIARKVYPEVPPRVEYRLTGYGETLKPILLAMREWGADHFAKKSASPSGSICTAPPGSTGPNAAS